MSSSAHEPSLNESTKTRTKRVASLACGPKPRRPSYAARVATRGAHDAGGNGIGVRARREQGAGSSADAASGRPAMFDMPPPSTTTSGSSTLISDARARPSRSWYRVSVAGGDFHGDFQAHPQVSRDSAGLLRR